MAWLFGEIRAVDLVVKVMRGLVQACFVMGLPNFCWGFLLLLCEEDGSEA